MILVTGAAGFLGVHLVKYLRGKGYHVTGVDNFQHPVREWQSIVPDIRMVDVTTKAPIRAQIESVIGEDDYEAVIHLAAVVNVDYSVEEPWESINANVIGTLNVLEACRKQDLKLLYASTCEVYGSNVNPNIPMDEFHPLNPHSPYGASKLAGEFLCQSYQRVYGLKVNVLATADNEAYIFIELDSVLRLIERQIQYPNRRVNFEEPYIVIYVWRGQI